MHRNCYISKANGCIKYRVNTPMCWLIYPTTITVSYGTVFSEIITMYCGFIWVKYTNFSTGMTVYYDARFNAYNSGEPVLITKIRELVDTADYNKPTLVVLTNIIDLILSFYAN